MIYRVEMLILGFKKGRKVIGPSYLTVELSIYKTTSDMFRTIWAFNMFKTEVQSGYRALNIIIRYYHNLTQYLCTFYFRFVIYEKMSSIFEFLTKFPFEKCTFTRV